VSIFYFINTCEAYKDFSLFSKKFTFNSISYKLLNFLQFELFDIIDFVGDKISLCWSKLKLKVVWELLKNWDDVVYKFDF
jgi:hypothetical protein